MAKKIDRLSNDIAEALAEAPVFAKQGTVRARVATEGETITTTLADGKEETTNTANAGDYIVTNPSGEEYIIGAEKFEGRYKATAEEGVYAANGFCRAITNPHGEEIEIMASWGEPQIGGADCKIADTCDENGTNIGGSPYLIDASAFAETYAAA